MFPGNYHTHTHFCDGQEKPEAYIKTALRMGLEYIGFSAHAPLPFPNDWTLQGPKVGQYIDEITRLKTEYNQNIRVLLGFEYDYLSNPIALGPGLQHHHSLKDLAANQPENDKPTGKSTMTDLLKGHKTTCDYTIGSTHTVYDATQDTYVSIDNSQTEFEYLLHSVFNNDIKLFVRTYYQNLIALMSHYSCDFIGHFDLIKKMNGAAAYFDENESWYRDYAFQALKTAAKNKHMVEVNTGGLARRKTKTVYPSPYLLRSAYDLNIPLTLSSDAHSPETLAFFFIEAEQIIKECGYRKIFYFTGTEWLPYRL